MSIELSNLQSPKEEYLPSSPPQGSSTATTLVKKKIQKTPSDWIRHALQSGRVSVNPAFASLIHHLNRVNGPLKLLLPKPGPLIVNRSLLPKKSMEEKMHENGRKAIEEGYEREYERKTLVHRLRDHLFYDPRPPANIIPEEITADIHPPLEVILRKKTAPIPLTYMISEEQGLRTSMEDRHFILPLDRGFLAAVFDGHRGHQTANKAAALFASNFQRFLKKANNNVGKAFKELFKSASEEIAKSPHNDEGSTAVICFIDRDTHAVYTATLGDSSANIYRKVEEDSICIPVSCTRDWSHEEDAKRAADYLKDPEIATNWTNTEEFIDRRVNSLNVSRAFGDKNTPPVSDEPVISINMLQPNDVLIISSDGLTNYMSPSMVAETVFESLEKRRDIAEDLVCDALDDFESKDNVTVIAISVH